MKTFEEYSLKGCEAKIEVKITEDENSFVPLYKISFPRVGEGTQIILNEVKLEILSKSKISVEKMVDQKFSEQVKKDFSAIAEDLLNRRLPPSNRGEVEIMKETPQSCFVKILEGAKTSKHKTGDQFWIRRKWIHRTQHRKA